MGRGSWMRSMSMPIPLSVPVYVSFVCFFFFVSTLRMLVLITMIL